MPGETMQDALAWNIGRYTLHGEIASGGMATVHIGRLEGTAGFAKTVAIKRLHAQFAKDPDFVSMFLDEARLAARINHPNVVQPLDVVATEGELFLVMEYIRGEALSRIARYLRPRDVRMPLKIVGAVMVGVLHGLHAAHEATDERGQQLGIVHRDISPQNVLVGTDGIARVLDFGIAKAADRAYMTREGDLKGKLAYMAPEQLTGDTEVDRRTDIYAAGIVMWELLTGQRLFDSDYQSAIMGRVRSGKVKAPSELVSALPPKVDEVVVRALDRDPAKRFASAREMAIALEICMPLATPSKVGEWVEEVARESLALRAKRIAEIEALRPTSSASEQARVVLNELANDARVKADARAQASAQNTRQWRAEQRDERSMLRSDSNPPQEPGSVDLVSDGSLPSYELQSGSHPSYAHAHAPAHAPEPHAPFPVISSTQAMAPPSSHASLPSGLRPPVPGVRPPPVRMSSSSSASFPALQAEDAGAAYGAMGAAPPPEPSSPFGQFGMPSPSSMHTAPMQPPFAQPAFVQPGPPATGEVRQQVRPRRSRVGGSLVTLAAGVVLVGALFVWALPLYIKRGYVNAAAARGVTLRVDDVDIEAHRIRLLRVTATVPDMPGVHARAGELAFNVRDGNPEVMQASDVAVTIDGPYAVLRDAFSRWGGAHAPRDSTTRDGLQRIDILGGKVVWSRLAGDTSRLDLEELTGSIERTEGHALGEDFRVAAGRIVLGTPAGNIGPYHGLLSHAPESDSARVVLAPPGTEAGGTLSYGDSPSQGTVLDVKLPRSSIEQLGIPRTALGLGAADPMQVEGSFRYERPRPNRVDIQLAAAMYGIKLVGAQQAVDVHLQAQGMGDPAAAIDLTGGVLTFAGFRARVNGSVVVVRDGFRVDATWKTAPRLCLQAGLPDPTATIPMLVADMPALDHAVGTPPAAGQTALAGALSFDSRDIAQSRVTVTPSARCGLRIFAP